MIWILIIYIVVCLFFWGFTVCTLKGVDWILISGINTLPKEDREKYKAKHNMVEMNRYAAKMIFLPFAVFISSLAPLVISVTMLNGDWLETWVGAVYGISVAVLGIGAAISTAIAFSKTIGGKFER